MYYLEKFLFPIGGSYMASLSWTTRLSAL